MTTGILQWAITLEKITLKESRVTRVWSDEFLSQAPTSPRHCSWLLWAMPRGEGLATAVPVPFDDYLDPLQDRRRRARRWCAIQVRSAPRLFVNTRPRRVPSLPISATDVLPTYPFPSAAIHPRLRDTVRGVLRRLPRGISGGNRTSHTEHRVSGAGQWTSWRTRWTRSHQRQRRRGSTTTR